MGTGNKGGKTRKRGKNSTEGAFKRELVLKEEGQEYGVVTKMLGNGRLEAFCYDGKTRQAHIRGNMRKKVWVNQSDTILISLRDYQDDKADVIHKYNPDEARQLKKMGELPDSAQITENTEEGEEEEDDLAIVFEDI
ncbi:translation initiation factor 1A [Acrasis kona]|uniref:Eukaryotic translation initiation factor 4C n=1 Tax=Acrasis kona TaxID=1008807 RepID=A0AAW2ZLR3_9EUKA